MYTYVGKKRLSGPKAEVEDILEELVDVMEEKYGMKASIMPVGSVKSNLVTADEDGHFDLDYNICFSKVPQDIRNNLQGLRGRVEKHLMILQKMLFSMGEKENRLLGLNIRKKTIIWT